MNTTIATTYPKIDLHAHILPGIDDGIDNIEEFEKCLKQLKASNIKQVVCTPHFASIIDNNQVYEAYEMVKEKLYTEGIICHFGFEFKLNYNNLAILKEQILSNKFQDLKYLLVELERDEEYNKSHIYDLLSEVMDLGYKIVFAHPEFYRNYYDLKFIRCLKENNVIIQCDASSFVKEKTNKKVYNFAKKLLKYGFIDIIASDYHDSDIRNYDNMDIAFDLVARKYGPNYANLLFYDNPNYVIQNFIKKTIKNK